MNFNWKPVVKYGLIGAGFVIGAVKEMMDKNESEAKMNDTIAEKVAEKVAEALANQAKES